MTEILPIRHLDSANKHRRLKPQVVDARLLAQMLTCGIRTIRTLDASGKLPKPIRIGGRTVWRCSEIREWISDGAPDRDTWEARKIILKHPSR